MSVLVLNAGYEPLHTVSVKHAMNMLWRGVATVEESHPEETFGPFPMPTVLRLVRYVKMTWAYARRGGLKLTEASVKITWEQFSRGVPTYSQAGVLKRDHGQCAYCGQPIATTMDHVVPKSRVISGYVVGTHHAQHRTISLAVVSSYHQGPQDTEWVVPT